MCELENTLCHALSLPWADRGQPSVASRPKGVLLVGYNVRYKKSEAGRKLNPPITFSLGVLNRS